MTLDFYHFCGTGVGNRSTGPRISVRTFTPVVFRKCLRCHNSNQRKTINTICVDNIDTTSLIFEPKMAINTMSIAPKIKMTSCFNSPWWRMITSGIEVKRRRVFHMTRLLHDCLQAYHTWNLPCFYYEIFPWNPGTILNSSFVTSSTQPIQASIRTFSSSSIQT